MAKKSFFGLGKDVVEPAPSPAWKTEPPTEPGHYPVKLPLFAEIRVARLFVDEFGDQRVDLPGQAQPLYMGAAAPLVTVWGEALDVPEYQPG